MKISGVDTGASPVGIANLGRAVDLWKRGSAVFGCISCS